VGQSSGELGYYAVHSYKISFVTDVDDPPDNQVFASLTINVCHVNIVKRIVLFLILCLTIFGCHDRGEFIKRANNRENGSLCFSTVEGGKIVSGPIECFDYVIEEPFLILDYFHDELWGNWPKVVSLSGYTYKPIDFTDKVIGLAIQDLCEKTILLKYESVFGDTVTLLNTLYGQSEVVPNFDFLSESANYKLVKSFDAEIMTNHDSIEIFLFEQGCFHHKSDRYLINKENHFYTIIAYGNYDFQKDSLYVLNDSIIKNIYNMIDIASKTNNSEAGTTYSSLYIKIGNNILNLRNDENEITDLLRSIGSYEPLYIHEK
jgi:hypothetical protein